MSPGYVQNDIVCVSKTDLFLFDMSFMFLCGNQRFTVSLS